jgi:hypothetical protein
MSNPNPVPASRSRKGVPNKFGADLKELVTLTLHKLGGLNYLLMIGQNEPALFVKLLTAIIPRDVSHSGVITGVSVQINTNLAVGNAGAHKQIKNGVLAIAEQPAVYEVSNAS